MDPKNKTQLRDTIIDLQKAFADWDNIPDDVETAEDVIKKRTRELLLKLKTQIEDLGL